MYTVLYKIRKNINFVHCTVQKNCSINIFKNKKWVQKGAVFHKEWVQKGAISCKKWVQKGAVFHKEWVQKGAISCKKWVQKGANFN